MLKWIIYYALHLGANAAAILLLREQIQINAGSLCPIIIMALMLLQALFTFYQSNDLGDTAYSAGDAKRLSVTERNSLIGHLKTVFLVILPFCVPFVFFFSTYAKLISALLYFLAYIIGGVSFKIKNGREISARMKAEKAELEEQLKREELG